jgi:peroxiredoxin family protein
MKFTSNSAASSGDSARVAYTSACGNSINRALRLTNTTLSDLIAPTSITITTISDVCGNRVYRYTAPALTGSANGYLWSFVGTLGLNAAIDSGTLGSRIVRMKFTSNNAAATGDSVKVLFTTSCGNSLYTALKLTNTTLSDLIAPSSITITTISDVCGNRVYRYTAPALAGSANGYLWSFVGTLGLNAVIDSGSLSSRIVRMKFTSNAAAATGDSARVLFTTSCGNSLNRALRLTNSAVVLPTTPASIIITTVTDVCGNKIYRYTAPALTGTATGYLWSFVGTLGLNATVDSGSLNSRIVRMKYTSNIAANRRMDSVRVAYTSACGNGPRRALRLSNTALANCPVAILPSLGLNTSKNNLSISKIEYKSLDVKLFPNPSTGAFYLKVNSASAESIQVRIIDLSGSVVKSIKTTSSETSMVGSELRSGIYFFEVKQGSETRIVKAVKY